MLGIRPPGLSEQVFVHPLSFVESPDIGDNTRVWAFAHIMAGSKVGARCNIGEHAFIETGASVGNGVTVKNGISIWDRVTVEDDVFLGPHMIFTNDMHPRSFIKRGREQFLPTIVKRGATIGAGATILCGVTIGEYAMVAAGAVVTKDVPDRALVMGNPARVARYVCKCLRTHFPLRSARGKGLTSEKCVDCSENDPQR